jgi:DNA polymerase-1
MKRIYLVDVSNMFFRAFFAIPRLTNQRGMPTNALYGFVGMTTKLLRENKSDYIAYCFDRPEPSFRAELYADYKANRDELPEDLEPQLPYIRKITEVLGIPILEKVGYEADDIIGTLACEASKKGIEAVIVSGDKDFAQLVDGKVSLLDTMKNVRYDGEAVKGKWGIRPEQMVDYLSIVGDTSDNIPGVRGIGPKGAEKLLGQYGTLENIYKNIDSITPPGTKQKLIDSKDSAFLAKKLVQICTDLDLKCKVEDLKLKPIDKEAMKALFEELDFQGMSRKLLAEDDSAAPSNVAAKKSAEDEDSLEDFTKAYQEAVSASVSVPKEIWPRKQVELSEFLRELKNGEDLWAVRNERGFCFGYNKQAIQVNAELEQIGEALSEKKMRWHGFDVKNLWWDLRLARPQEVAWDTMLASYVLKARPVETFGQVYKSLRGSDIPDLLSPEEVMAFEVQMQQELVQKLAAANGTRVLNEFELPLVPVLYGMEKRGVQISQGELHEQSLHLHNDINALEAKVHKLAGEKFNVASPKQLGHILFEKMKIPAGKKTKTGYSTDSDVLSKLSKEFPICDAILEYRELTKLKSTYVDALPGLVDSRDDRLHTHFQQAVTTTGRLSSTNPNLQNIPIRTERGREIRKAFICDEGHQLLSVDYSQIELRVLAEITGDKGLREAFENDLDIHAATAAEIFDIKVEDVNSDHRRMAKAVNFGLAYGQGVFGLAETLDIPRDEAKQIIDNYFKKFKKVREFMTATIEQAKEKGYVESLFGRRRYLDELKSSNQFQRKAGERAAINAPIQGTASDLMKKAMIAADQKVECPMVLQVHDELLFECKDGEIEKQGEKARDAMENVGNFKVHLKVNISSGKNWDEAH